MKSKWMLMILFCVTSCRSHPVVTTHEMSGRALSGDEAKPDWTTSFLTAQKTCKTFLAFKKTKAPTDDLSYVAEIKFKEKCAPNENLLKNLKYDWLKKDIVINGLRNTKNPDVFVDYYSNFAQLSSTDRTKIEFAERARLFKKILSLTKDQKTKDKIIYLFPAFYLDYKQAIPHEKLFEAGYELRMERRFADARKVYGKIIADGKYQASKGKTFAAKDQGLSNILKATDFVRNTYRVEEKKQKGITEYRKTFLYLQNNFAKNPKKEFGIYLTTATVQLARDMWTEGQIEEARKILESVAKKFDGKTSLDQIYWVLGRMEQEKKNYSGAVDYFKKALTQTPEKDFELKLLWLVAWNNKKNGKLKDAIASLKEYGAKAEKYNDDINTYKSLFWQAKIQQELKNKDEAKDLLQKVAEKNPLGYYGRLAMLEVYPEKLTANKNIRPLPKGTDLVSKESQTTIHALLDIAEYDIVAEYLSHLLRGLEKSDRKNVETRVAFFAWSDAAQLYKENLQFLEILDDDSKKDILTHYPQLFFPEPFLDVVKKASSQSDIPREFIYSLMRQESLFDKNARSQADAFGLLQLLPQMARKYTSKTGVNFKEPEDLFKPDVIIPLGAAHLHHLLDIFDDSMLLTAASYNAGVEPVKGWIRSRYNGDSYEFIEDIPYLETEYYTKLIFRNLSYYIQFHDELSASEKLDILRNYFKIKASL